jgi:methylenetetrahydrofolate dehydrogenase (NADP+)/methenyltetrahydrofolate cyclohydrolase
MVQIVDGKLIAQQIKESLRDQIINESIDTLRFDIIYVGSDPVIDNFIKYKKIFGEDLGVDVHVHHLDADIQQDDLLNYINQTQKDSLAMIVQLPLPKHLDQEVVLNKVHSEKDVDVLGVSAQEDFRNNEDTFFPPVTGSIVHILENYAVSLADKNILLVGNGSLVGYPMSLWLQKHNYHYNLIVKDTDEAKKKELLSQADIIISGAGVPSLVTRDLIKEGVVLIDAGTSESGKKVIGDIDPLCSDKASLYTPVPGGIGPITIAILYRNIIKAHQQKHDK